VLVLCIAKCNVACFFPLKGTVELRDALSQIDEIRQQMARSETFRGYRSVTSGCSGVLALLAAACQPYLVPRDDLGRYLALWVTVAAISLLLVAIEIWRRMQRESSSLTREVTRLAIEQFLPCIVIGAILTLIIYRRAPEVAWMLPGLWSLLFGLGVFASYRLLPRQSFFVGLYYVACGIGCLLWGDGENALSPWQMAISFGGGQLLGAAILYWTLERTVEA
jgi:hypothetical protein